MRPLELIADTLFLIGAGLGIAACALVSTVLALGVAALTCLATAAILTAVALKRPPRIPNPHGPFEREA